MYSKEHVIRMRNVIAGHFHTQLQCAHADIIISPLQQENQYCKFLFRNENGNTFPHIHHKNNKVVVAEKKLTGSYVEKNKKTWLVATHKNICYSFECNQHGCATTISDTRLRNISINGKRNKYVVGIPYIDQNISIQIDGDDNTIVLFVPKNYKYTITQNDTSHTIIDEILENTDEATTYKINIILLGNAHRLTLKQANASGI